MIATQLEIKILSSIDNLDEEIWLADKHIHVMLKKIFKKLDTDNSGNIDK